MVELLTQRFRREATSLLAVTRGWIGGSDGQTFYYSNLAIDYFTGASAVGHWRQNVRHSGEGYNRHQQLVHNRDQHLPQFWRLYRRCIRSESRFSDLGRWA